jgi:peptidyl-prolyl cis-trans isomerase B (cyclophilin B)
MKLFNLKRRIGLLLLILAVSITAVAQENEKLKRKDRKRDVELVTTAGTMVLRLYDVTPLHRDNFLRLVKSHYLDSMLFHRVIKNFMIQSGDPNSKRAVAGQLLGNGGPGYTVAPEFRPELFHKKGVLAAARTGDDVNPERRSSASQFYIVQGKTFTDAQLDSVENGRLKGRKIPVDQRAVYKTLGGTPQLDQGYTVFGELVSGFDVLDSIASTPTSKAADRDRPLQDVRIISAKLVKRKKH